MEEERLRRVIWWNQFWLAVLALALLAGSGYLLLQKHTDDFRTLKAYWDDSGGLRLTSVHDGPFVVTHLARYGATEGDKATAALPEPLAITDSAGDYIEPDAMRRLVWRSAITRESNRTVTGRTNLCALLPPFAHEMAR